MLWILTGGWKYVSPIVEANVRVSAVVHVGRELQALQDLCFLLEGRGSLLFRRGQGLEKGLLSSSAESVKRETNAGKQAKRSN